MTQYNTRDLLHNYSLLLTYFTTPLMIVMFMQVFYFKIDK